MVVLAGGLALLGVAAIGTAIVLPLLESPAASEELIAPVAEPAAPVPLEAAEAESADIAQLPVGIADRVDPAWVRESAERAEIPERALAAYAGAAMAVTRTHPECGIGWNTLAAIGLVESEHGSMNGARIDAEGRVSPRIRGVALDGNGVAAIGDTDGGLLDGDPVWDRAVGPMQFIPETWAQFGRDGNGDGIADVNHIDDAALSAAVYLCEAGGDLTVPENWIAAVHAYNATVEYNHRVAEAASHYAARG